MEKTASQIVSEYNDKIESLLETLAVEQQINMPGPKEVQ